MLALAAVATVVGIAAPSCDDQSNSSTQSALPAGSAGATATPSATHPGATASAQPAAQDNDTTDAGDAPKSCEQGGTVCPSGLICCPTCCIAGMGPACVTAVDGKCPLPDLTVSADALAQSAYIETIQPTDCEVSEQCVAGDGPRKVLRFDVQVANDGASDLHLGNPDGGGPFVWAQCHQHYHFLNFSHYELVDPDGGTVVLVGRKQAFCAEDTAPAVEGASQNPHYDCGNQGIQAGWEDVYGAGLQCQYLDVTDVPSGTYRIDVEVNRERVMTETDYGNNLSSAMVKIP